MRFGLSSTHPTRPIGSPYLDTICTLSIPYLFSFRSSFDQLVKRTNIEQNANFYPLYPIDYPFERERLSFGIVHPIRNSCWRSFRVTPAHAHGRTRMYAHAEAHGRCRPSYIPRKIDLSFRIVLPILYSPWISFGYGLGLVQVRKILGATRQGRKRSVIRSKPVDQPRRYLKIE